ncbi:MAG: transglutaminase domain-containing protein, partial [Gammaproteobacteria bacterium]|nr:transglutaminase domain-containing protein [Gammaproteobacteria bacterium]
VPALEMADHWNLPRTFMGRMQQLTRVHPIDQRVAFEVESYTDFRVDRDLSQYMRGWYLDLPEDSNPRTVEFAKTMLTAAGSKTDYINDVIRMFNVEEFYYTLRPPELGINSVDQFLFETRQGFCEHYASAFAVMMRAVGIPARVILGYQGGEINPMGGHLIVRQSDAHAWAEVWLAGAGWVRIDPTAAVAPQRIEVGFTGSLFDGAGDRWGMAMPSELLHRLQLTWDALNASWNDLVLGYGPEKQESFMKLLGMENPSWRKMLLTLITFVIALTLLVSLIMHLRNSPPGRDRAAILYDRFIRKTRLPRQTGETPAAFAARVKDAALLDEHTVDRVTDLYMAARYGDAGDEVLPNLEREIAAIRALSARARHAPPSTTSPHR